MDQITRCYIMTNDQYTLITSDNTQPNSIHGKIACGWILQGFNPKVMTRSSQGHGKVKSTQNRLK